VAPWLDKSCSINYGARFVERTDAVARATSVPSGQAKGLRKHHSILACILTAAEFV
jgi:hypothetical protein